MRAIVLLLLAGSVLWFVLRTESSEDPTGPDRQVTFLGAEETAPATPSEVPAETGTAGPAAKAASDVAPSGIPPVEAETRPSVAPPVAVAQAAPGSTGSDDELELASELVHRPASIEAFLQSRPTIYPEPRRQLASTLARAIVGDPSAAQRAGPTLWDDPSAGTSAERALLRSLAESGVEAFAPVWGDTPLARASSIGALVRAGHQALEKREFQRAAEAYSAALIAELQSPWPADTESLRAWTAELRQAQSGHQWNRKGGWPSLEVTVEKGDSLISIRKRVLQDHPELLISTGLIERANQARGDTIQPGQVLRVPTERAHVLVDVDAHWVLYYLGDLVAAAWEVGVGKPGSETPPGNYTVGDKNTDPMWFPPGHQPVPFGDPENPLGTRWIGWVGADGRNSRLAFHGTKDPNSIGQDQSQGCIRMLNRDVEELFEILPKGADVRVQP